MCVCDVCLVTQVKIVADKTTDKLLGVHIMGANAGEMIHEVSWGGEGASCHHRADPGIFAQGVLGWHELYTLASGATCSG